MPTREQEPRTTQRQSSYWDLVANPSRTLEELQPALDQFRGAAVQVVGPPLDVGEHIDDPE